MRNIIMNQTVPTTLGKFSVGTVAKVEHNSKFSGLRGSELFEFVCLCSQAWERLEKAEHDRERVLRDELIRQEKLEQMARRFDRKAAMRETWLQENQRLVTQVTKT